MKKVLCVMLCILLSLSLSACGGSTRGATTRRVPSEIYSLPDIESAINVIKAEFRTFWSGCTLIEISYAGDEKSIAAQDMAAQYGADEVIVLTSSFRVDSSGGDGSLEPNSTCDNWTWTLVRTKGGNWRKVAEGYG